MHTDIAPPDTAATSTPQAIAPAWQTISLFLLLFGWATFGYLRTHNGGPTPTRLTTYTTTIVFQWMTTGCVVAGLYERRQTLSAFFARARLGFWRELGIGVAVLIAGLAVGGIMEALLHFTPLRNSADLQAVARILPQSNIERAVWILISLTAGFCEEFLFRGYLQTQLIAFTRNVYAGIIISACVFGAMHIYQGAAPAISIAALGAWLGIVAHKRKTIRSGIIAHSLQDILGGLLRSVIKHR